MTALRVATQYSLVNHLPFTKSLGKSLWLRKTEESTIVFLINEYSQTTF